MKRPLILERPVILSGEPGRDPVVLPGPRGAALDDRDQGPLRPHDAGRVRHPLRRPDPLEHEVSYGPAVIGTTDSLDRGHEDPKAGSCSPGSTRRPGRREPRHVAGGGPTDRESSRRLQRSNRQEHVAGWRSSWSCGPWAIVENEFLGSLPPEPSTRPSSPCTNLTTSSSGVTHRPVEASGKTWRFLVMTQGGTGDLIRENTVEGIGPRNIDTIPA